MGLLGFCVVICLSLNLIEADLLDDRIIGGNIADIQSLPYQVSLQYENDHFCGGSVINKRYILTAAHCLEEIKIKAVKIRAGSNFWNKGGFARDVCDAATHRNYKGEQADFDYDIAILKLCKDLPLSITILPVALPQPNELIQPGSPAVVSGWGRTNNSPTSNRLLKVSLITYNQTQCQRSYGKLGKITPRMLCAGCEKGSCDSCDGDSGGPLVANGRLVGIVSWGRGCANRNFPGIYTRVCKFAGWIKSKTRI